MKLHNNYGMELKAAGRIQEARNQYKVLRISYLVLYTLIEDDYVTNVVLSMQLAMEIDPDYGEVYFNYGNLLSDEGEYEAAAARYYNLMSRPPPACM